MFILGIESSCDETAAAVVRDGRKIISNIVYSQEKVHRRFKGIVPEIASRAHLEKINDVIGKAIEEAGCIIDAVAVTEGPGLVGSLLVGKMAAEAVSWAIDVPLVGVNHLEAHLLSSVLEHADASPPFLGLIVSGGHTDLIFVEDFGKFKVIGRTRDDAAGESFDKAANILGIGYPGGPLVDRYAKMGNPHAVPFTRPYLNGSWDFSFSGLKTAALYFWREAGASNSKPSTLNSQLIYDVCASFQAAVVDVLVSKTFRAAEKLKIKKIVIGGGVSANSELRKRFLKAGAEKSIKVYLPSEELCTDNAAMVACAGYFKLKRIMAKKRASGHESFKKLNVNPSLPIMDWCAG